MGGASVKRGEVRWHTLRSPDKHRPVLILTRDSAIEVLTGITVAPITSTIRDIPTEVMLTPAEDGILTESAVNLDNLQTISKANLGGLIAILSAAKMEAVENGICFALGVDRYFFT